MGGPWTLQRLFFTPISHINTLHYKLQRIIEGISRKNKSAEIRHVYKSFEERRNTYKTNHSRIVEGIIVILFSNQLGELGQI